MTGAFLAGTEPSQDCNGATVAVSRAAVLPQRPAFEPGERREHSAPSGPPDRRDPRPAGARTSGAASERAATRERRRTHLLPGRGRNEDVPAVRLGDDAIDDFEHLVSCQRLAQPCIRAGAGEHLLERLLGKVGDQDDRDLLLVRLRLEDFAQSISLDARKVYVEENHVGRVRREDVIELDPACSRQHGAPFALEQRAGKLQHERVVVEYEDREFVE